MLVYLCSNIYFVLFAICHKGFQHTVNKNFIYYFSALFHDSSVYQRKIYLMFAMSHYDMLCYYWQIDPLFCINQNIQLNDKTWVFKVAFVLFNLFYKHLIFNWAYGWKLQEYMSSLELCSQIRSNKWLLQILHIMFNHSSEKIKGSFVKHNVGIRSFEHFSTFSLLIQTEKTTFPNTDINWIQYFKA